MNCISSMVRFALTGVVATALVAASLASPAVAVADPALDSKLCDALEANEPDGSRVRQLLDKGADANAICTTTIWVPKSRPPGILEGLGRSLGSGKPSIGKAIGALVMLPLIPIFGVIDALASIGSGGKTAKQVETTPLVMAAQAGCDEAVIALAEAGAELNVVDSSGVPPVYYAIERALDSGDSTTLLVLFEHGATLEAFDGWEPETVLGLAKHDELFALMADHGLDVDANTGPSNRTALHMAIEEGSPEVAERLLDHGASVDILVFDERSVVFLAAKQHDAVMLDLMLARGGRLETVGAFGKTSLWLMVEEQDVEGAALLLERGADLAVQDSSGNTPLHLAAQGAEPAMVSLLLVHGGDVEARTILGRTPLDLAISDDRVATAGALLEGGADAMASGGPYDPMSPLCRAVQYSTPEMIGLLMDHGATLDKGVTEWVRYIAYNRYPERDAPKMEVLAGHGLKLNKRLLKRVVETGDVNHMRVMFSHDHKLKAPAYKSLYRWADGRGMSEEVLAVIEEERLARKGR